MEILSTCAARVFQSRHNENSIMCNAKRWTLQRRGVRVLLVVWMKIVKDVKRISLNFTVFLGAGSWTTEKVQRWGGIGCSAANRGKSTVSLLPNGGLV